MYLCNSEQALEIRGPVKHKKQGTWFLKSVYYIRDEN